MGKMNNDNNLPLFLPKLFIIQFNCLRALDISNHATPSAATVRTVFTGKARVFKAAFAAINYFRPGHISGHPVLKNKTFCNITNVSEATIYQIINRLG
jgi:hypothetical protein